MGAGGPPEAGLDFSGGGIVGPVSGPLESAPFSGGGANGNGAAGQTPPGHGFMRLGMGTPPRLGSGAPPRIGSSPVVPWYFTTSPRTQLIRFDVAPGLQTGGLIDNIPGAIGDLTDNRAGLLFVKIAYSDGSRGVLVVSCRLPGGPDFVTRPAAPASIFEGITASKSYTDYWNRVPPIGAPNPVDGNRTLFHVFHEDETHD